jgi:hypothetical protein
MSAYDGKSGRGTRDLRILALLHCLVHGLEGVFGQLGGDDELAVNVLDFLHHIRLELREGLLQGCNALQGRLGCLDGDTGGQAGFLCAQWLEDGVYVLDRGQLVVEDVGPGIAPLLGGFFELLQSVFMSYVFM